MQVRAAAVRHPVPDAIDRVVRLVLQAVEDVRVVRDEVEVHRRDVALRDQPQRRVARGRHAVVRARRDEVDHVVRARAVLRVDLAAGLLGELVRPRLVRVAGPDDEIDLVPRSSRSPGSRRASSRVPRCLCSQSCSSLPPPQPAATTLSAATSSASAAHTPMRFPLIRILPPIRRSRTPVPGATRATPGVLSPRAPRSSLRRGSVPTPAARHPGRA